MRQHAWRKGIVLYTLLGVLVIVAILAISLNSLTVQKTRQSQHLTDSQDCMLLGRSLVGYAVATTQACFFSSSARAVAYASSRSKSRSCNGRCDICPHNPPTHRELSKSRWQKMRTKACAARSTGKSLRKSSRARSRSRICRAV